MNRQADYLLALPVSSWAQHVESLKAGGEDLQAIESHLSAVIQRAALLEAYVSHRFNTGCGDQGHKPSAKRAKSVLVKVRKALGFSYPSNTPLEIT